MITREVVEVIYNVKVSVIAKCNAEQATKFIKKRFGFDPALEPKSFGTIIQHIDGKHFIIWLRKTDFNTIAHECCHLIDDIYSYRGIAHDEKCTSCSEHRAYQTAGWINIIRSLVTGK
jgi:hypothetical protein